MPSTHSLVPWSRADILRRAIAGTAEEYAISHIASLITQVGAFSKLIKTYGTESDRSPANHAEDLRDCPMDQSVVLKLKDLLTDREALLADAIRLLPLVCSKMQGASVDSVLGDSVSSMK